MHIYIHVCTCILIYIYIYTYINKRSQKSFHIPMTLAEEETRLWPLCVYVCVLCLCMCVHERVFVSMYLLPCLDHLIVCVCLRVCVCVRACVFVRA